MSEQAATTPRTPLHTATRSRSKRTIHGRAWPTHLALALGAVVMISPFVWQILTSFKTFHEASQTPPTILPQTWVTGGYHEVFKAMPFGAMLTTSIVMTVGRTVGQVLLSAMAAYAFARLEFRGRNVIFMVFLAMLMVPYELFIIPQYELVQRFGWLNTYAALIVPRIFSAFGVFLLRQFFMTMPRELDEAARLDGASPGRQFFSIMLPLAKPGLVALSILTILASWRDLLWPLVVSTDPHKQPLAVGLASLKGEYYTNYPVLTAGALLAMLPVIVLFAIMQRQFIQGIAFSGSKG